MRSTLTLLLAGFAVAACISKPVEVRSPAIHDLGATAPLQAPVLPLRRVEVVSSGWLKTPAMQYRLGEAASERRSFADNRWAAAPGDLIEGVLLRALGAGQASRCTLTVRLDELIQIFDGQAGSRVKMTGSVFLRGGAVGEVLAQRGFDFDLPTSTADAAGGAAAVRAGTNQLAAEARTWLGTRDAKACTAGG